MGGFHKAPGATARSEPEKLETLGGWVRLTDGSMVRAGSPAAEAASKAESEAKAEAMARVEALSVD